MRKKIIVFAGFILMTFVFSMFRCTCKTDHTLDSINARLCRITERETWSMTVNFTFENIYRLDEYGYYCQDDIISIAFDSLAIDVRTNYTASNNYNTSLAMVKQTHERVIDIVIISNKNYNANYPAGSNLKEIISVWSFDTFIRTIDAMLESVSNVPDYGYYMFNIPPETEEIHDITIIYRTDRKRVLIDVIQNVKILK